MQRIKRNQTFSNIQNPSENRGGDDTQEQHSDLFPAGKLADRMEQPLLLLEHFRRLTCRLDGQDSVVVDDAVVVL